jgi:hypothetical protein
MKTHEEVDVQIHVFLPSALVGGSDSRPGRFKPGERAPSAHWIEGWVGPSTGLADVVRRKILPLPGLEVRPVVVQPIANRYTEYDIPVLFDVFKFSFFYLDYETMGTAATPGLLCQPRVIMKMIVESMLECTLAGETEVLGDNLPQRHFCPSQNPTCPQIGRAHV